MDTRELGIEALARGSGDRFRGRLPLCGFERGRSLEGRESGRNPGEPDRRRDRGDVEHPPEPRGIEQPDRVQPAAPMPGRPRSLRLVGQEDRCDRGGRPSRRRARGCLGWKDEQRRDDTIRRIHDPPRGGRTRTYAEGDPHRVRRAGHRAITILPPADDFQGDLSPILDESGGNGAGAREGVAAMRVMQMAARTDRSFGVLLEKRILAKGRALRNRLYYRSPTSASGTADLRMRMRPQIRFCRRPRLGGTAAAGREGVTDVSYRGRA